MLWYTVLMPPLTMSLRTNRLAACNRTMFRQPHWSLIVFIAWPIILLVKFPIL